jgi:hypothetical protein
MIPDSPPNDRLQGSRRITQRYAELVTESVARRAIHGDWRELPLFLLACVVKGPRAIRGFRIMRADRRGWRSFIRNAVAVMAYPLMVNASLRYPASDSSAGLVLVTFDPPDSSHERMLNLGRRILSANRGSSDPDAHWAAELMADENYRPNRRRRVPPSLTDGLVAYACDLWIPRMLLKGNYIGDAPICCMAEPGNHGRINILPWWIAADQPNPSLNQDFSDVGALGVVTWDV